MAYTPSAELVGRVEKGETFAVARLISRAEAGVPEARAAIGEIYRKAGRAHVVGITGVPGSGKSTLVGVLVKKLRATGATIAVVAIDPSSPYSGGSILGDRIRMADVALDPGVFIRSMATRGAVGGMAHAALDVVDILDVAGFDWIVLETVGVGQDEVEIAHASHTTVVVSAPGLGDEVQAIKAGILEIADIHVVSKCDRSDANRTLTDLKMMLKEAMPGDSGWRPPVVGVSALNDQGLDTLLEAAARHRKALDGPAGERRRRHIAAFRLAKTAETLVLERLKPLMATCSADAAQKLSARHSDPYSEANRLVGEFTGENDHD
ncbi:methylmalonyl Co-A mutase-associated GTPase MeaB [Allomesorhizobium alhagi]|uniref:LAO/AO transport system ATPase n=1 Tax=Mesorhizobium alhagi CCNWXJ12-2 TaxID=1107882 RepID=H0HWV4_9HYPH|nr:methylmalonyl Co-A mutase-associated GTPase MeaB [Mesorhizobium alhagi]EHK54799.1 LAO/AO transport system ATPase [Mesorhizobium alhagi CCNWXJ12-2]